MDELHFRRRPLTAERSPVKANADPARMFSKLFIACLTSVILLGALSRLAHAEQFVKHNIMGGSANTDYHQ